MNPADLVGRPVLVTGASRGIGRAVAKRLADAGANVHMLARDREALAELCATTGGTAWPCDMGEDADVWTQVEALGEAIGGPPYAVVNAAGAFDLAPLAETSVATFDRNVAVNLRGAFLLVRALLPGMLERGSGRIVNVGSVAGRTALPGNAAYAASKFGLRGLHEVLVEELRGSGVEASLIEPSATDTSLWDALDPDNRDDLPSRDQMLGPDDVAGAVLFVLTRPAGVNVPLLQIQRS